MDATWEEANNWTPAGIPGGGNQIEINNGDTVGRTGDITLADTNGGDQGMFLTNGGLNVSGNFIAETNGGGSSSYANEVGTSGGATTGTLDVGGQ